MSSIDEQLDFEIKKINEMNKIETELNILEKNLNQCIDITSQSIYNPKSNSYFNSLREDNINSFNDSKRSIENNLEESLNTINNLKEQENKKENEENS